jgi:hypothetical protein
MPAPPPGKPPPGEAVAAGRSLQKIYKASAGAAAFIQPSSASSSSSTQTSVQPGTPRRSSPNSRKLRVDDRATFANYLARIDQSPAGYTADQLARKGALLDFRVRIEGFKGKTLLLKWELFDDRTGKQRDESKAIRIRPTNATNEATWQF